MERADGAFVGGGWCMAPNGGKDNVHQWLHKGSGIGRLRGRNVPGSAVQCFSCTVQVDALLTDALDQVSQVGGAVECQQPGKTWKVGRAAI